MQLGDSRIDITNKNAESITLPQDPELFMPVITGPQQWWAHCADNSILETHWQGLNLNYYKGELKFLT